MMLKILTQQINVLNLVTDFSRPLKVHMCFVINTNVTSAVYLLYKEKIPSFPIIPKITSS